LSQRFTLITGRTSEQGKNLHLGKDSEPYRRATALVEMNLDDMAHLGVEEGQMVQVRTSTGRVEVPARTGQLPPGLLFMPMGPTANVLIGSDTECTGMPPSKGLMAEVEQV
jgi:formylmethanofuran dehydrogenase subunit D